ncbi:hypothetical protein ACEQ8H_000627 [Pleosporales sp. CAS-2024a]
MGAPKADTLPWDSRTYAAAFGSNASAAPAECTTAASSTRSTTPDSTSERYTNSCSWTTAQSDKHVGGAHQMNDVKLPGYWTHQRSAALKAIAEAKAQAKAKDKLGVEANAGTGSTVQSGGDKSRVCKEEKKKKLFHRLFHRKA